MSNQILELSLLDFVNGPEEKKQQFVDDLMRGLKEYGFIILKDHTIDNEKVQKSYDLVHEFFHLPEEIKLKYFLEEAGGQRGYTPFKKEIAKGASHPDLKEFWHVGRELPEGSKYRELYGENVWPEEIPAFKKELSELFLSMDATANIFLEAIGKGLNLPEGFFRELTRDGNSILRTIHYPATKGMDTQNHVRAGAHEDINLITLLVGSTASGLELLDHDGKWLPVKTEPHQIIVDTGDMMARLTNKVLPATTHRVVNPDNDTSERYSMPFFVHPHAEASLKCIPSCLGDGEKFPEITAGEFLKERLEEIGLL